MTAENPSVASGFDSALLSALVASAGLTALSVPFDVCGVRVFECPENSCSYVDARPLRHPPSAARAIQAWPHDPDSIFEFTHRLNLNDGAFRPGQLVGEAARTGAHFFSAIEALAPIVDCFCVTFKVRAPAWGMIACLRCRDSDAFTSAETKVLQRLKPGMARLIGEALDRAVPTATLAALDVAGSPSRRPPNPEDILARLSRTEREVLQYLYSPVTERQIAQSIHRSPHTIHVHVKNIYRKLGVNSRQQLQTLSGK